MKDWSEMPESSGPSSEGTLFGQTYGSPGMPTIGRIEPPISPEMRDREREQAARAYEVRLAAERAALQAGMTAMEAAAAADRLLREADSAAAKAVRS